MNPKALKEELNAFKEVDEHTVARPDILRCLENIGIRRVDDKKYRGTNIEENPDSSEDYTCKRKRLHNNFILVTHSSHHKLYVLWRHQRQGYRKL